MSWKDHEIETQAIIGKKRGLGVIVARFQVPELSEGHREVLRFAAAHQRLLVVLGVPNRLDHKNPLPFECRVHVVRSLYPNAIVVPHLDLPVDDKLWSLQLDALVEAIAMGDPVTLYGGRDSFLQQYKGHLHTAEVLAWHPPHRSGSDIRGSVEIIDSVQFRSGLIYGIRYAVGETKDEPLTTH